MSIILLHIKMYNLSIFSGVTRVPAELLYTPAMRQCWGQLHTESAADRPAHCPVWQLDEEQSDPECQQHSPSNPNTSDTLVKGFHIHTGAEARCSSLFLRPLRPQMYGSELCRVESIRYLGVFTVCSCHFSCQFHNAKKSFYRSFNTIFGKIGRIASVDVVMHLIKSKCIPILLYAEEACSVNRSLEKSLEFSVTRILMKFWKLDQVNL